MPELTASASGIEIDFFFITTIYVAFNALIMLGLAYMVVSKRRANFKSSGAETESRDNWIRAHANNTEYVPMALMLMASAEVLGGAAWFIHGLGILLTISRILHGYGRGSADGANFGRFYGTLGTWIVFIAGSLGVLYLAVV